MSAEFWVFDLDGTLADCDHRVQWAQARQWDEFHARLHDDKARPRVAGFFRALSQLMDPVVIVTGRPERYRNTTVEWLKRHDLLPWRLLMRPDLDWSVDAECKLKLLEVFCAESGFGPPADAVIAALEDRDRVVEGFRAAGIETWQVTAGAY